MILSLIIAGTVLAVAAVVLFLKDWFPAGWAALLGGNGCFIAADILDRGTPSLIAAAISAVAAALAVLNLVRPRRRGGA